MRAEHPESSHKAKYLTLTAQGRQAESKVRRAGQSGLTSLRVRLDAKAHQCWAFVLKAH